MPEGSWGKVMLIIYIYIILYYIILYYIILYYIILYYTILYYIILYYIILYCIYIYINQFMGTPWHTWIPNDSKIQISTRYWTQQPRVSFNTASWWGKREATCNKTKPKRDLCQSAKSKNEKDNLVLQSHSHTELWYGKPDRFSTKWSIPSGELT